MTEPEPRSAPVGIRPAGQDPAVAPAGPGVGSLRWVEPGSFELRLGDRVAVRERDLEWLGEVVVPADRLVEWSELGDLPIVTRRATDAEWPAPARTDGRRLLDSLGLAPELLARGQTASAPAPFVARTGRGSGEAAEDERADQERGRDQRERD